MRTGRSIGVATALLSVIVFAQQGGQTGAVQMPGDNGKIGTQYSLGKKGEELVFTLEKAEFANRYFMKDQTGYAEEGQRLVVLTYSVQNPSKADRQFFNQSFSFTVVSPDDENFECDGLKANGWQAIHPERRDKLGMMLKPAQKVKAQVVVQIHQKGPINKLIVQRGKGTPVLRYDLKGKVAPLKGAFADNDGLDAIEVGVGKLGQMFDIGPWNITVESVEDRSDKIGDLEPDGGGKFVIATLLIENASMVQYPMHSSIMAYKMNDADNNDIPYAWQMLKYDYSTQFNANLDPGAKAHVRVIFKADLSAKANSFVIKDQQSSGRSVKIQLGE